MVQKQSQSKRVQVYLHGGPEGQNGEQENKQLSHEMLSQC